MEGCHVGSTAVSMSTTVWAAPWGVYGGWSSLEAWLM